MGATAEELPGLGQGQGLPEPEPFSPSDFLDLPPTPSEEDPAASADDLALPFISRMLMEEDIDDKFVYHYHDHHPALLQAQQQYAQILSDAAAASDSFTTNTNGSGDCILTSSPDAPAFANATWPYDPVELSQQLLPAPCPGVGAGTNDFTTDGGNQLLLPQQDTGNNGEEFLATAVEQTTTTATCSLSPAGDGEHDALASTFFDGRNTVDMDMLNQAFHRGMEEAKKFLPIDETRGSKLSPTFRSPFECGNHFSCENEQIPVKFLRSKGAQTTDDTRNEDNADRRLTYQGIGTGCGCKSRYNWQDLETERGRKSKFMVLESEETGEMIDEIILNEYRLCLNGMLGLHISMDSKGGKKNMRKGNRKSAFGTQSSNETEYLHTLLIHCAQAVSMDDRWSATKLLWQIKQHSSPRGDANQRLAHYLAEGLEARLAGIGNQVYKSLMSTRTSLLEMLKAYQLYLTVCCFKMMAYKFSNMTIANVIAGRKKLHIVDYGILHGLQWPSLLGILSTWEGGPPKVRITGIDLPQPGFRPAAQIEETGRRLSKCAHQFGIPFKFQSIAAKWEMVSVDDLNLDPDEALIINGLFKFGNLMDEGSDIYSPSPRDVVLGNIRKMRPDVFIFSNSNLTHGTPFFVTLFREVLFYFSSMFDMLDATVPRDNEQRLMVERHFFRRSALNLIACEGSDRVERDEMYRQWQVRNQRAGLRQLPLDPDIVEAVRKKVKDSYHKDFVIDVDQQWLLEGWKGRIICAMSTWVADDAFSEH